MRTKSLAGRILLRARRTLPDYRWALLLRDAVAGLTVATVAVPQAMAYALLAGVPAVHVTISLAFRR